jgi:uncharacterized protein YyaL (SSP411 family)
MNTGNKKANRLINESSPYLLQHAYNPVDWFPWGDEALKKAEREDKLLIISIGYAACHWCHVMEHESFEDSLVASVMNEHFVSIKVDREERPDVDDVYMTAAQLLSGRGGWPLNAIALPNGKPVFAGTYYPKEQWLDILNQIIKVKNENPARLEDSANKITEGISSTAVIEVNTNDLVLKFEDLKSKMPTALSQYDKEYGGRSGAPKFPMPNSYEFLMKYYWMSSDEKAIEVIRTGLDNMARGGIFDQLGGGFARYSVDPYWLVPHFEKMLYDNGQLVSVYAQAYKLTGEELYKNIVDETLAFIEREMSAAEGGFYSSLDADSEGEEGKFYVWQKEEIENVIQNAEDSKIFCDYYNVTDTGNWEHKNILNVKLDKQSFAEQNNISIQRLDEVLSKSRAKLMSTRDKRVRPGLDDKILTSWNALMISGYVDAYTATGNEAYLERALKAAEFIISKQMQADGRLNRNYKEGKSSINAFLDDYALLIQSFIKIYQVTFDIRWIQQADKLMSYCITHFFNEEQKMFNYTSDIDPPLIAKKAEYEDNVIPSSNSAIARALFELGTLKYNNDYIAMSEQMLSNMIPRISSSDYISFYSNWYQLMLDLVISPFEVAVIGEEAIAKNKELQKEYTGNSIFLGSTGEENLELLKEKLQEKRTMIYVCQNKTCKLPVSEVTKALDLIHHELD